MPRHTSPNPFTVPLMFADLTINACETIAQRAALIMTGRCTEAEYRRMVVEKAETAHASLTALAGATPLHAFEAAMTPWLRSVKANAKRLRQTS